ncbi:MASE1 domain-containing protein [Dyella acidisoli]|nr:MASE1 domain-containing protein [Dyella acidisoli]
MAESRLGVRRDWWKHLVVVAAYGAAIWLFQHLFIPHFLLACGLRVGILMLMPYRYWPAMAVAEVLTQAPIAIECATSFGVIWSALELIPGILLSGPIVYVFRQRKYLFNHLGELNVGMLLACTLIVSIALTVLNQIQFATVVYSPGVQPMHYDHLTAQWVLGYLLGILTVAPSVLAIREAVRQYGWRTLVVRVSESRSTLESACFTGPILAVLVWVGLAQPHLRNLAQVLMFMPVVWLALRHGWQGAALGGTVASLALVWLMPEKYDHATIQAEVILAFAISTMLLVGARVEALDRKAERERQEVRTALAIAQRNVHLGELQLRMAAQALEQARETVRGGFTMMLGRLRHLQPAIDDGGYQRVALAAQDQLFGISDSLHPVVWRERGLAAALREGTVARLLDHAGVRYWCEFKGPVSSLSSTVHLAIYRTMCEAVAEGCRKRDVSDVCVRVRCGDADGRRWVVVSIVCRSNLVRLPHVRWDDLLPRLVRTTTGMGIKAIRDRAAAFEGYARIREIPGGRQISWLMWDL